MAAGKAVTVLRVIEQSLQLVCAVSHAALPFFAALALHSTLPLRYRDSRRLQTAGSHCCDCDEMAQTIYMRDVVRFRNDR